MAGDTLTGRMVLQRRGDERQMGRYIHNEWLKLRYNRVVLAFAGVGIAFSVFAAACVRLEEVTVYDYAWLASTEFMKRVGGIVSILMVGIAAGIFSMDFKQHTVHNALSCGVSRSEIFISKVCVYYSFGFIVQLISLVFYTVLVGLLVGWASPYYHYPHLVETMIVFHMGEAVIVFFYMSCFLFLGMIFRNPGALIFAGICAFYFDTMNGFSVGNTKPYWSPMYLIQIMRYYLRNKLVLSAEFVTLFIPCLVIGCLFLFIAYLIFRKRDID